MDKQPENQVVKFFYKLVVPYVMPSQTADQPRQSTPADSLWQFGFAEFLAEQIEGYLGEPQLDCDFIVRFDEETSIQQHAEQPLVSMIPFWVSTLHEFEPEQLGFLDANHQRFSISQQELDSLSQAHIEHIRKASQNILAIDSLKLSSIVSRTFVINFKFEAQLSVHHIFCEEEISLCGSVNRALEDYFNEIENMLGDDYFISHSNSTVRRKQDNEYLFTIRYSDHFLGLSEDEVEGAGCDALDGLAPHELVDQYGVEPIDCTGIEMDQDYQLSQLIDESLPKGSIGHIVALHYVGDDDLYEIEHNLVLEAANSTEEAWQPIYIDSWDLNFRGSKEPIPAIEIDVDSIPSELGVYGEFISGLLSQLFTGKNIENTTLYTYTTPSTNFHRPTFSLFVGAVGDDRVLNRLLSKIKTFGFIKVKHSESILQRQSLRSYHIEQGHVWIPADAVTWAVRQ